MKLRTWYGGTFDPVHDGHLAIARAARDALDCTIRLMPAADPPHRPPPGADAAQRADMLALLESALAPGGQLVLSCEAVIESGPDLALRPSGCCAYKHSHVHALGQAAVFDKVEIEGTMLRQKNNAPVHSFVAWAHKPA